MKTSSSQKGTTELINFCYYRMLTWRGTEINTSTNFMNVAIEHNRCYCYLFLDFRAKGGGATQSFTLGHALHIMSDVSDMMYTQCLTPQNWLQQETSPACGWGLTPCPPTHKGQS